MVSELRFENGEIFHGKKKLTFPHLCDIRLHAKGGNAIVCSAFETILKRHVALKVWDKIPSRHLINRALAETRNLAKVANPLFVAVHRFGSTKAVPYAILEFVPGITARTWLSGNDRSFRDRVALWNMYIRALQFVYEQGSLHGDPHSKNVLLFDDPEGIYSQFRNTTGSSKFGVKLTDPGTSRLLGRELTEQREATVVLETAKQIFKPEKPSATLDLHASRALRFVISAIESFSSYQWQIEDLRSSRVDDDDYKSRAAAFRIALEMVAVPIYDLKEVVSLFEDLAGSSALSALLSYMRAHMLAEIEARSIARDKNPPNQLTITYHEQDLQQITQIYSVWRSMYLTMQLYELSEPPVWPVFRSAKL